MIHVQGLRRNVKNVVKNYSDAQVKVREATSNDPWGPSGTLMSEIADLTYNVVAFSEIMQVIWKRLNDHGKNWKHVYKALVLLEYLIKTGSEKVTQQCKENLFAIQTLRDFQYFEESKDQGVNVREKAKQLVALLKDDERLKSERSRALKARERFARATAYVKQDTVTKRFGSSEFSHASFDEDMLSPGALSLSELEQARPQTAGEEELQLRLALAMSKEEADQAERLKRNDDLRLQMALSESEEEFKKKPPTDVPQSSSAMEDLLGLSLNINDNAQASALDPWGLPLTSSSDSDTQDVWNTNIDVPERNRNIVRNDPWSPALDNSNRGLQNCSLFRSSQDDISDSNIFDLSNMKKSLSADVSAYPVSSGTPSLDAYLSNESSLIHFDQTIPKSRTHGNPFEAAKPCPPTINEMRAQNHPLTLTVPNESGALTMSTSMPLPSTLFTNASYWSPKNVSQSQNPFM